MPSPATPPPRPKPRVGPWRRCLHLLGPLLATADAWFLLWLLAGNRDVPFDALKAAGFALGGLGTSVVFGRAVLGEKVSLTTWDLAFVVMWVNAASAWLFAFNLDLGQKLPVFGPYLARARANAVRTLRERPWIRRLSTIGVGLFVLTPLPGSGALGGSIVGRLLGISKFASFLAVTCAGVVVCVGYASAAQRLEPLIVEAPTWMKVAGAVLFLVLVWLLVKVVQRMAGMEAPEGTQVPAGETPTRP
jgi:uncharacterized membrane protein